MTKDTVNKGQRQVIKQKMFATHINPDRKLISKIGT